jgi:hypothetical protein
MNIDDMSPTIYRKQNNNVLGKINKTSKNIEQKHHEIISYGIFIERMKFTLKMEIRREVN